MPPRGVRPGSKRGRQYQHVKESERKQGRSPARAEEIAARTVNKERARSGEAGTRSRTSTADMSSGRRGGLRSGRPGPAGARAISSTTRPASWASKAARR